MFCRDRKLIFVHLPKTGGSSIERALDPNVGTARHKQTQKVQNTELKGKHWPIERYQTVYPDVFDQCFKFGFVRNPWERYASFWNWGKFSGPLKDTPFPTWLERVLQNQPSNLRSQTAESMFCIGGECEMDFFGRFEHLHRDFDQICDLANIGRIVLPHANNLGTRPHYSELYTQSPELIDAVGEHCQWVINTFGYEFQTANE